MASAKNFWTRGSFRSGSQESSSEAASDRFPLLFQVLGCMCRGCPAGPVSRKWARLNQKRAKTGARPVDVPSGPDFVHEHVGWQGWSHWLSRSRGEAWAADDECATDEQKADRARLAAPGAAARASERERARERDFALGVVSREATRRQRKQDSDSLEAFLQHEKMRRQGRCDSCNDFPAPGQCLKKCGGCGGPRYCSLECQSTDWPSHKAQCMAARAARK